MKKQEKKFFASCSFLSNTSNFYSWCCVILCHKHRVTSNKMQKLSCHLKKKSFIKKSIRIEIPKG